MFNRIKFFLSRLRERLWVRPLLMCVVSIAVAFLLKLADYEKVAEMVPVISPEMIETLLKVIAASMLVIATFAVGSMVSSYASAGSTATPRAFALIISDDVSQNALSSFIGAFIFSIVALISLLNEFYGTGGLFALFCTTLVVFGIVILTFVKWVDAIARLGRLGTTIDKVESATASALKERRRAPTLGGVRPGVRPIGSLAIEADTVGYVQRVDVQMLQDYAVEAGLRIEVASLPGSFSCPGQSLAYVVHKDSAETEIDPSRIVAAFIVGDQRTFAEDPRFGLVVLSEIAGRALSPGINDPGTAIDIIGTLVRLFTLWAKPIEESEQLPCEYDRIEVPELSVDDMFDDAFLATARDGAATVEVMVRLQKALHSLAVAGDFRMSKAAKHQARLAMARAELAMDFPGDLQAMKALDREMTTWLEEYERTHTTLDSGERTVRR